MTERTHEHPHDDPPGGGSGRVGGGQECLACPICVFLQALTHSRPEVTEHLVAAARELSRALQAVVDAHAGAHEDAGERLERIDVD